MHLGLGKSEIFSDGINSLAYVFDPVYAHTLAIIATDKWPYTYEQRSINVC